MDEIIYIISFVVFVVSYYLFKKAAGTISLQRLNTVSYVFYYSIIISTFVGSVLCALGFGDDHWILCNTSSHSRLIAWIAVCYSLIAIPLGMIITNRIYKLSDDDVVELYSNFEEKELFLGLSDKKITIVLLGMSVFSVLVSLYIYLFSGSWPLYTAIVEQDFLSAREERIDVRLNFQGIEYVKNLFGLCLVPMFSYFAYIIWQKLRTFYSLLFYLVILSCTITSVH